MPQLHLQTTICRYALYTPKHLTRAGRPQSIEWPDHGLNSRWIVVRFQAWAERPDYLWSTPSLFFNRDASVFQWRRRSRGGKLTTHSQFPIKTSVHAHRQLHLHTTSKPTHLQSYVPPYRNQTTVVLPVDTEYKRNTRTLYEHHNISYKFLNKCRPLYLCITMNLSLYVSLSLPYSFFIFVSLPVPKQTMGGRGKKRGSIHGNL